LWTKEKRRRSVLLVSCPDRIDPISWDGKNRKSVAIIVIDERKIRIAYKQAAPQSQIVAAGSEIAGFVHGNSDITSIAARKKCSRGWALG
jgi:hypothetical protein